MALLDVVEAGQMHVTDARFELDRVREALDRTDAVLGVADDALDRAETAIVTGRHWAPYIAIGVGVVAVTVIALVVWRRRGRDELADA
jgi:hypothetical protein